jgi:hypothetical protein
MDMAKAEGNDDVAAFLEICTQTASDSKNNGDGLRKRK